MKKVMIATLVGGFLLTATSGVWAAADTSNSSETKQTEVNRAGDCDKTGAHTNEEFISDGWKSSDPNNADGYKKTAVLTNENNDRKAAEEKQSRTGEQPQTKSANLFSQLFSPIGAAYWNPHLSGNVTANSSAHEGDKLDLNHDLNMSTKKPLSPVVGNIPGFILTQLGLYNPSWKLQLDYDDNKFTGSATASKTVWFKNSAYRPGEKLYNTLTTRYITLKWLPEYTITGDSMHSPIFGLINYGHKQTLAGTYETNDQEFKGTEAVIGYRVETGRMQPTTYFAEGLVSPGKNYYYNLNLGVLRRLGNFDINIGYRTMGQKAKSQNDVLEYRLSGPYFQLLYNF